MLGRLYDIYRYLTGSTKTERTDNLDFFGNPIPENHNPSPLAELSEQDRAEIEKRIEEWQADKKSRNLPPLPEINPETGVTSESNRKSMIPTPFALLLTAMAATDTTKNVRSNTINSISGGHTQSDLITTRTTPALTTPTLTRPETQEAEPIYSFNLYTRPTNKGVYNTTHSALVLCPSKDYPTQECNIRYSITEDPTTPEIDKKNTYIQVLSENLGDYLNKMITYNITIEGTDPNNLGYGKYNIAYIGRKDRRSYLRSHGGEAGKALTGFKAAQIIIKTNGHALVTGGRSSDSETEISAEGGIIGTIYNGRKNEFKFKDPSSAFHFQRECKDDYYDPLRAVLSSLPQAYSSRDGDFLPISLSLCEGTEAELKIYQEGQDTVIEEKTYNTKILIENTNATAKDIKSFIEVRYPYKPESKESKADNKLPGWAYAPITVGGLGVLAASLYVYNKCRHRDENQLSAQPRPDAEEANSHPHNGLDVIMELPTINETVETEAKRSTEQLSVQTSMRGHSPRGSYVKAAEQSGLTAPYLS